MNATSREKILQLLLKQSFRPESLVHCTLGFQGLGAENSAVDHRKATVNAVQVRVLLLDGSGALVFRAWVSGLDLRFRFCGPQTPAVQNKAGAGAQSAGTFDPHHLQPLNLTLYIYDIYICIYI